MLVTIARFSLPLEAHIAKSKLEANAIPAYVANEHTINMNWLYSDAMGGVQLQVEHEDAAQALVILEEDHSQQLSEQESVKDEAEPGYNAKSSGYNKVKVLRNAVFLLLAAWLVLQIFVPILNALVRAITKFLA